MTTKSIIAKRNYTGGIVVWALVLAAMLVMSSCGGGGGGSSSSSSGTTSSSSSSSGSTTSSSSSSSGTTSSSSSSSSGGTGRYIALSDNSFTVDLPSVITMFFQASDQNGTPVTTLANQDFTVFEDNAPVDPTESFQEIVPHDQLPYTLKTVLLIDVSSSISASDLANMKAAAKNMVANRINQQQIAIYTFDDSFMQISDFTSNTSALNTAIDTISIGNPSTDLYGSIGQALTLWTDSLSAAGITQGSLIVITDGKDTASTSTLSAAVTARGSKRVFTIGVGANADSTALSTLGNAGYFSITNFTQLQTTLGQVSTQMAAASTGFYYLHYASPKRSGTHSLTLKVANNTNTSANATITGTFNASGFSSVTPLTSFVISPTNPGITTNLNKTQQFEATGTFSNSTTQDLTTSSTWNSSDISVATISNTAGFNGLATAVSKGTITIRATSSAATMFKTASATLIVSIAPIINTIAGNSGGPGASSCEGCAATTSWIYPLGVAIDSSGSIYIVDGSTYEIRKVNATTGIITTVAGNGTAGYSGDGGPATSAGLGTAGTIGARGVSVDSFGNIYIADSSNNRIRKVAASTGIITTVAGNGTAGYSGDGGLATAAKFSYPSGVAVDSSGNIYIADSYNNRIRKVNATTGIITTVAGNGTAGYSGDGGPATSAEFNFNTNGGLAVDTSGNIYIADWNNHRVRKVTESTGIITTVAGNGTAGYSGDGGPATLAEIYAPSGVAVDSLGNIYISDWTNSRIWKVTAATGIITTVTGNGTTGFSGDGGPAILAKINWPGGVAVDSSGNIYIVDDTRIREVLINP